MVESELVSLISFLTRAGPRLLEDLDGVVRAFALGRSDVAAAVDLWRVRLTLWEARVC